MTDDKVELDLLIVDDDAPFLSRLGRAMEQRGYEVRSANSVKEGLAAIAKRVADKKPRAWPGQYHANADTAAA